MHRIKGKYAGGYLIGFTDYKAVNGLLVDLDKHDMYGRHMLMDRLERDRLDSLINWAVG
jgi:hypothetical protein